MKNIGRIPDAQTDPEVIRRDVPVMRAAGKKVILFQLIAFPAAVLFMIFVLPKLGRYIMPYYLAISPLVCGAVGLVASAVLHNKRDSDTIVLTGFSVFFLCLSALFCIIIRFTKGLDMDSGLLAAILLSFSIVGFNPLMLIPSVALWLSADRMIRLKARQRKCKVSATADLCDETLHNSTPAVYQYTTESGNYYFGLKPEAGSKKSLDICYDEEHPERFCITDIWPEKIKSCKRIAVCSFVFLCAAVAIMFIR